MDTLTRLLSSRVKAQILRLLFGIGAPELHVREMARRAGLNDATVRQELRRLTALDLVEPRRDGNRVYYRAALDHPLYPDLHSLVMKTSGLGDILRKALGRSQVRLAFVFGSIVTGAEDAESDIDVFVVGAASLRELARPLAAAATRVGREINPHVMEPGELRSRLAKGEHFVTSVLKGPKLWILGSDDELGAVAR